MAFTISCPACQTDYPASEAQIGQTVKCQTCGTTIRVSAPGAVAAKPLAAKPVAARAVPATAVSAAKPARRPVIDEDDEDDRPRGKKGDAKKGSLLPLIAGAAAVLIVGGGAGAYFAGLFGGKETTVAQSTGTPDAGGPSSSGPRQRAAAELPKEEEATDQSVDATPAAKPVPKAGPKAAPQPPTEPERKQAIPAGLGQLPKAGGTAAAGSPPPPTKTEPDSTTLKRCKEAAVFFRVESKNGGGGEGSGWFALEPNLIVTNAHVLGMETPNSLPPKKVTVFINPGTPQEKEIPHEKLEILAVDRDADLALLKVRNMDASQLPPPLQVRPTRELRDLEPVVVIGYPGGSRLSAINRSRKPPLVTNNLTRVGAIRYDDNGNLYSVQIQGGAAPGNSGGPIIDMDGNVIGVLVRAPADARLAAAAMYGVPTEQVSGLVAGRIGSVEYGQPYNKDGKVHIPVTATCLDPFNRLSAVGVGFWVGENTKKTRPPGPTRSPAEPGDGDFQEVKLAYKHTKDKQTATGEVVLPTLPAGRAYWTQPYYSNALTAKQWLAGNPVQMVGPPVDLAPADLIVRYKTGTKRTITVSNKSDLQQFEEGEGADKDERVLIETRVEMTETVTRPASNEGVAALLLEYKKLSLNAEAGVRKIEDVIPAELRRLLNDGIKTVQGLAQVNRRGEIFNTRSNLRGTGQFAPIFKGFSDEALEALAAASVPLPNEKVNPGHTWKGTKNARLSVLFLDPADALPPEAGKQPGPGGRPVPKTRTSRAREYRFQEEITYTYIGSRTRAGTKEAVIKVEGVIKPAAGTAADRGATGKVKGFAYVDLDTGVILEADLEKELEVDSSGDGVKRRLSGINEYKLSRGSPIN